MADLGYAKIRLDARILAKSWVHVADLLDVPNPNDHATGVIAQAAVV